MTLCQDIMNKISEEHVTPKARWKFVVREYGVWITSGTLLLLSSLVLSVVIYILAENDWDVYEAFADNVLLFIFLTFPYALLFIGVVGFILLYVAVRHTKRGYKFSTVLILALVFLASFALGSTLHAVGISERIDNVMTAKIPAYTNIINPRVYRWNHPEKGMLAGQVMTIPQTNMFVIKDRQGQDWVILVTSTDVVSEGERFRIIGRMIEPNKIQAHKVLHWKESQKKSKNQVQRKDRPANERKILERRNTDQTGPR